MMVIWGASFSCPSAFMQSSRQLRASLIPIRAVFRSPACCACPKISIALVFSVRTSASVSLPRMLSASAFNSTDFDMSSFNSVDLDNITGNFFF